MGPDVDLVSHFHWDREWYRSFEVFRGRLVDAIDAVLDQLDTDPGFRFVLDGQTVVLDDYLEVRPERREALTAGVRGGRLGVGPWYVQPDSLLPAGESHVRNLLHGRAIAETFGGSSRVAYVPDSFGHPAQFPQLFSGFGLDPFVYWRGNGTEIDTLAPLYRWRSPDGSEVRAWYLGEGYFGAAGLDADDDVASAVQRLQGVIDRLARAGIGPVLLMNGFDHMPADTTTAAVAEKIGAQRALLDDTVASLPAAGTLPEWRDALVGARTANLLPGVWSSRMPLKLRNRAVEQLLTGWAEPWAALGRALGLDDERPAIDRAWRALLQNQAHDSIGGCSIDPVHERMTARYDDAEGLGRATVTRVLERLSGRNRTRATPWRDGQDIVVFNASSETRTDVVRVPLDPFPPWRTSIDRFDMHPLAMPSFGGLAVDGSPVRVVASDDPARVRFLAGIGGLDVELVASDVPAFGCRRYSVVPADPAPDEVDDGSEIEAGDIRVRADDAGTLSCTIAGRVYDGLFGLEDCIDRGDSYDADPDAPRAMSVTTELRRTRHACGISRLRVTRTIAAIGTLTVEAMVAPGVPFVRCEVTLDNRAEDHRLRLRFPTGAPIDELRAATTFDTTRRTTVAVDDALWVHRAPRTFVHQGWIAANGLTVGAPGLPEAEIDPTGEILVTLVRSVGALARLELRTRPVPAGPEMPAPGAQVQGIVRATLTLAATPSDAHAAETGMWGVLGDDAPLLPEGVPLLELDARASVLSACKPAADGDGIVVRVLNPSDEADHVVLRFGLDVADVAAVRLDETPDGNHAEHDGRTVALTVPPHALRSVRVHTLRR
jgi:mannosylglycerate hydrolase